jgi:hypothetical protein
MSSKEMLESPSIGNHYVQLYQNSTQLAEAVCHFIADDLMEHEGLILVATPDHTDIFLTSLTFRGYDTNHLITKEQLTILDAQSLLNSFMLNGKPNARLFLETLGPVFRKVFAQYSSARVYGEMVNLLWKSHQEEAAIQLEILWNALLKDYSFSLLCAYEIDNLHHDSYNHGLDCICNTHTHLLSPQDAILFEKSILDATREIAHVNMASMIYSDSKLGHPTTLMSPAQASIFYLNKNQPLEFESILAKTKKLMHA